MIVWCIMNYIRVTENRTVHGSRCHCPHGQSGRHKMQPSLSLQFTPSRHGFCNNGSFGDSAIEINEDEGNGQRLRAVKSMRWLKFVVDSRQSGMSARCRSARSNHSELTLCPRTIENSTPSEGWMT